MVLKNRISQFWRHQKKSPRWYLATVEAIHQFLVELHTYNLGETLNHVDLEEEKQTKDVKRITKESDLNRPYDGQYDNLLFFFKYMYEKIHLKYDHDKLWAYKRPLI